MNKYLKSRRFYVSPWRVLLGGAAGFVLGLLVAPEEGPQFRRRVSYRLERLAAHLARFAAEVLRPEADSEARRTGDALVEDARVRAQRIRDDIDALLGEFRQQGSSGSPPAK